MIILYFVASNPTETFKVREYMCTYFRAKFEHKEYNFGRDENVTFLVYVYGFKTPFWLQVSKMLRKFTSSDFLSAKS